MWSAINRCPAAESVSTRKPETELNVSLYPTRPALSATSSPSETAAVATGRASTVAAMRRHRGDSTRDAARRMPPGQNAARPATSTSAGNSVAATSAIDTTPSARYGPNPRSDGDAVNSSAAMASTMVPADDASTSPVRPMARTIAACRSPSGPASFSSSR